MGEGRSWSQMQPIMFLRGRSTLMARCIHEGPPFCAKCIFQHSNHAVGHLPVHDGYLLIMCPPTRGHMIGKPAILLSLSQRLQCAHPQPYFLHVLYICLQFCFRLIGTKYILFCNMSYLFFTCEVVC